MDLAEQLGALLSQQGKTIVTAESCTGGMIAARLTDISGSSVYVLGGVVAYSNAVKMGLLRVREETLIAHGAVSEQTASEMASGARQLLNADYALSVTGVAGPGGGSAEKPVGLTYIGLAGPGELLTVERHVWPLDRHGNRVASVDAALKLALKHLQTA